MKKPPYDTSNQTPKTARVNQKLETVRIRRHRKNDETKPPDEEGGEDRTHKKTLYKYEIYRTVEKSHKKIKTQTKPAKYQKYGIAIKRTYPFSLYDMM